MSVLARTSSPHVRQHGSVLASLETQLLIWIAMRLPAAIHSDHLTALGGVAMLGVGAAFAWSAREPRVLYVVPLLLVINWFGDSLDGTVARVRNRQRPRYGYYVDHVVDIVGAVALFGGLALSGGMQPLLAMALLVAYLATMGEVFLATHVTRVFRLASFGFGPTELRVVLAVGAIALVGRPLVGIPGLGRVPLFDVGGVVALIGLTLAFVVAAIRTGSQLAREERLS